LIPCFSPEEDTREEMGDISIFVYQELRAFSSLAMDAGVVRPRDGVGVEDHGVGRTPIVDAVFRSQMNAPAIVSADAADIIFTDHVIFTV